MGDSIGSVNRKKHPSSSSESENEFRSEKRADKKNNKKNSGVRKEKLTGTRHKTPNTPLTKLNRDSVADYLDASESSDDEPIGMTKDQFLAKCKEFGFSDGESEKLIKNVEGFVNSNVNLNKYDEANITRKKTQIKTAKDSPDNADYSKTVRTTAAAGASAYLTSFFLGKLAANFAVFGSGSPHGVWAFLIAGLANPLLSEPLANAIRNGGAAYASPDGSAYTDYRTATFRLEKAKSFGDQAGMDKWTKVCADIVDSVIKREQAGDVRCLCSNVKSIKRDKQGYPLDRKNNRINKKSVEDSVIVRARARAFLTDEMPFFIFSFCYTISGGALPFLKVGCSPLTATLIDLGISASLGTLAGASTAMTQNFLRKNIQGGKLTVGMSSHIKGAHLALASAQRDAWHHKRIQHSQVIKLIDAQSVSLSSMGTRNNKDSEDAMTLSLRKQKAEQELKKANKNWRKYQREHERYSSQFKRIVNNFIGFVASYSGEKSLEEKPMEGIRARNRTIAKSIAVPMSLCASCIYNAWAISAALGVGAPLLNHSSSIPLAPAMPSMEGGFMQTLGFGNYTYNSPALSVSTGWIAASMLAGFPLILGFVMRAQLLQGVVEKILTKMERAKDVEDENDSSTVSFASDSESEDDSSFFSADTFEDQDYESINIPKNANDSEDESPYLAEGAPDDQDHVAIAIPKMNRKSDQNKTPSGGKSDEDEGYSTAGDNEESAVTKSESDEDDVESENESSEVV